MSNEPELTPPRRTWLSMLAALRTCSSCGVAPNSTTAMVDEFCRDCLERSRDSSGDQLGGEA